MSSHRLALGSALLLLVLSARYTRAQGTYLQIVFDASGSMEKETERTYSRDVKVQIAREELRLFAAELPRRSDFQVALRVFGTRRERRCDDTALLRGFAPVDDAMLRLIDGIAPAPFGRTPIARSLDLALADFQRLRQPAASQSVILITDGVETCDGNVDESISKIFKSHIKLKVHIVGFDVLDLDSVEEKQLENVAKATGGEVLHPKNREELSRDLASIGKKEAPSSPHPPAPAAPRGLLAVLRENLILTIVAGIVLFLLFAFILLKLFGRRAEEEEDED